MKHIYLFLICINTLVFSQNPIEKTLGEFSTLKVYDLINLELIHSDSNKIVISGQNTTDVSIIQKNNTLKIRMRTQKMFNGSKTNVKLYYTSVDVIDANEGSEITIKDPIKQYELTLKTQEGAKIYSLCETKILNVKCITGGTITASGTSDFQDIMIRTGGEYFGSNMTSLNTDVKIKTGGEASVNTTEILDINIFSGGDVFIYGKPKQVKQKRIIGGRVIFKD